MLDDFANQIPRSTTCSRLSEPQHLGNAAVQVDPISSMRSMANTRTLHHGNCDTHLVLAFQDRSARVFASDRADALPSTLMAAPIVARGSLAAATLEQVERAGSKTIRSTGSCPRREAMQGRSRRRVLAAPAPGDVHRPCARDHGKARSRIRWIRALTIGRDALTAATTCSERGRTR
ncbi:MAG: hypothetical protein ACLU0O_02380 [Collinsella sp.]